ncbi:hypothetical protein RI367_005679 [Sorochytrium milnesiophthora]
MFWTALNLRNCLPDSPAHRKDISTCEDAAGQLESLLKSLIKLSKQVVDTGKQHNDRLSDFADELYRFGTKTSDGDPVLESTLTRFTQVLKEIERSRRNLHELFGTMFIQPLEVFVDDELHKTKDCKKRFDSASDNLDNTLEKYMSKKHGDTSIPEVAKEVAESRQQFHANAVAYCMRLNDVRAKRRFDILDNVKAHSTVLSQMYNFKSFYHQGFELLKDLDPEMKSLTDFLDHAKKQHALEIKEQLKLKDRILEPTQMYSPMSKGLLDNTKPMGTKTFPDLKPGEKISKAGYLFKKNQVQRMRQTWSRRYFAIKNDLLIYSHRRETEAVVAMNLRYSTVKVSDHNDRRFCFDVISAQKSYTLQAENEEDMHSWIEALQRGIGQALHAGAPASSQGLSGSKERLSNEAIDSTPQSPESAVASKALDEQKAVLERIRAVAGNSLCCDCGADEPEWASINLGVVLCIECSGIHRSLGVHISKVRSLILDKWEPEIVQVMLMLGNEKVNALFEAAPTGERINAQTDRPTREKWISAKYSQKEFIVADTVGGNIHQRFWEAISGGDLFKSLTLLANGANIDWHNPLQGNRTALHNVILNHDDASTEFLLQWQCEVDELDTDGCTPLHYCAEANSSRLTTPLDTALTKANVQVVTVLRLFSFNNEQTGGTSAKFGFQEAINNISTNASPGHASAASTATNGGDGGRGPHDGASFAATQSFDSHGDAFHTASRAQSVQPSDAVESGHGGGAAEDAVPVVGKRRSVMDINFDNPWQ